MADDFDKSHEGKLTHMVRQRHPFLLHFFAAYAKELKIRL